MIPLTKPQIWNRSNQISERLGDTGKKESEATKQWEDAPGFCTSRLIMFYQMHSTDLAQLFIETGKTIFNFI